MIFSTTNNQDLSWAIMLQMEDKLTRADVLGIIETHNINWIYDNLSL